MCGVEIASQRGKTRTGRQGQTATLQRVCVSKSSISAIHHSHCSIYHRLDALGYGMEVLDLGIHFQGLCPRTHTFFMKAQPLFEDGESSAIPASPKFTDIDKSEWTAILPTLLHHLDGRRILSRRRVEIIATLSRLRALDQALNTRCLKSIRLEDKIWPCAIDMIELPEVSALVQHPVAVDIPLSSFSALIEDAVPCWRQSRERTLLALLPGLPFAPSIPNHPPSVKTWSTARLQSPLNSPTASFWCPKCWELVAGEAVMIHTCCYEFDPNWRDLRPQSAPCIDGAYSLIVREGVKLLERTCIVHSEGYSPWSLSSLRPCIDIFAAIWAACGIEPRILNPAEPAFSHIHVACGTCSQIGKTMVILSPRRAVRVLPPCNFLIR